MADFFKASEAAILALHSMAILYASNGSSQSSKELSKIMGASSNHLSKVLLKLTKAGLVKSYRGPAGGFLLGKQADQITLKEIYEAIEGPISSDRCFFHLESCNGSACALGAFSRKISSQIEEKLAAKKLSQLNFQINLLSSYKDGWELEGGNNENKKRNKTE